MRVAVLGYQTWGHRTLSAILKSGHEVVLVITHPVSGHPYEQMWSDSVEELANSRNLPVIVNDRVDQATLDALRQAKPDVLIANNWRTWLPPEILEIPRYGAFNVHDGLLPEYAGFSPVLWALLNGETHVGVTVHQMNEILDGGPIVAQQAIPVEAQDTTTSLVGKTIELIEPLLEHTLESLEAGTMVKVPQDPSRSTYFHKRSDRESRINFNLSAREIELLVRAQSDPYPNAHFDYRGQRIRVLKAHVSRGRFGGTPGRITIPCEGGIAITCGAEKANAPAPAIVLELLRLENGEEVEATDFFGYRAGYIS